MGDEEDAFGAIVGEEGDYYLIDDGFVYDEYGNVEYEYYFDDDDEQMDEDNKNAMDTFFDETHEDEWIVTNEVTNDYDADWEDDSKWSEINEFTTFSAKKLKKKCMNVFGRKLCLCEFVEFMVANSKKHVCHPNKAKKEKQAMIKKIKQDLKKKDQKMKKKKKIKLKKIKKEEMERRKR